jgi:hypothetical protein
LSSLTLRQPICIPLHTHIDAKLERCFYKPTDPHLPLTSHPNRKCWGSSTANKNTACPVAALHCLPPARVPPTLSTCSASAQHLHCDALLGPTVSPGVSQAWLCPRPAHGHGLPGHGGRTAGPGPIAPGPMTS